MRTGCIERGVTKLKNVRKAVFLFDLRPPHPWAVCFGMDSLCSRVKKCWKFFISRRALSLVRNQKDATADGQGSAPTGSWGCES